jgi:transcription initiation factor TFIIB
MIDVVMKIIKVYISKISTSGKDPKGIVAGALYLACKLNNKELTQKHIADVVGVTEVTLRSRFKEFEKLNIII